MTLALTASAKGQRYSCHELELVTITTLTIKYLVSSAVVNIRTYTGTIKFLFVAHWKYSQPGVLDVKA